MVPFLTAENIRDARIAHGFLTRVGGVSEGRYARLNTAFSTEDAPECVLENRARIVAALGMEALACASQVHGVRVVEARAPFSRESTPEADALVSNTPGLLLGIQTADCAPVLFADAEAGVVGAAHAGWRGALDGVLEETLAAMEKLGARRAHIAAAIGPCIGWESYEVGEEFRAKFLEEDKNTEGFFKPGKAAGKHLFGLREFALARLKQAGISSAIALHHDTLSEAEHFFSHRRATLEGDARTGRQMSVIGIRVFFI